MINEREIQALVSLLDDPDQEVFHAVEDKLLSFGQEVIPYLEGVWGLSLNSTQQDRIENLIHKIQLGRLKQDLNAWFMGNQDLLDGMILIARYQYPDLEKEKIVHALEKIRLDAWLEMHNDLTSFEKVKIFNHIFYTINGFKGNTESYHSPQNSFINTVLESKQGNPITLSVIYSLVAQKLDMPVFGVNLPQHFMLAYLDDNKILRELGMDTGTNVLFYINAFNGGGVYKRENLEMFLKQLRIQPIREFFVPCSSLDIIKRVLRNLLNSFAKEQQPERIAEINELREILGETPEFPELPKEESGPEEGE